ncbi:MAG: hypothetical protein IPG93_25370 [Burkholderiales bacterium]|nr:hypothetical protein [Burkholderiales bacterium]
MRRELLILFGKLTIAAFAICPSAAMSQDRPMSPTVTVIGVYSPSANKVEYEAFVAREVAARNPINFLDETKAFLARVGRTAEIAALSPDELAEIRADLEADLSQVALVEILVGNPDSSFSIDSFQQPDPDSPKSRWQAAWCEKFLTADGAKVLPERKFGQLPTEKQFRIAFYIHDWKQERGLNGPYGPLQLPPVEPMPQRLWQLAPYEQVD